MTDLEFGAQNGQESENAPKYHGRGQPKMPKSPFPLAYKIIVNAVVLTAICAASIAGCYEHYARKSQGNQVNPHINKSSDISDKISE